MSYRKLKIILFNNSLTFKINLLYFLYQISCILISNLIPERRSYKNRTLYKELKENGFDIIFDTVGLEVSRNQAIHTIAPGGVIVHVGLTQSTGSFNFKKLTIQEIIVVGTYCYTNKDFKEAINILAQKKIGSLKWIEYRELKNGAAAFNDIHNASCIAPKIILIP